MSDLYALDVETEATDPSMKLFGGLQPWRVRQGKARITSIAVCRPDDSVIQLENIGSTRWANQLVDLLVSLKGCKVYAHNAVFDVAWLICTIVPDRMGEIHQAIKDIHWRDTGLLCKWLINGQLAETTRFSYTLVNLIMVFLKDHPLLPEFVELKNRKVNAGENPDYWLRRGELDVIMTRALAVFLESKLSTEQRVGVLTEFKCIVPVANSWVMGIRVDRNEVVAIGKIYEARIAHAAKELGVPASIFTSTKALPDLLFNVWKLPIIAKTPKGAASCAGDTIKWLHYELLNNNNEVMAKKLELVLDAKQACTLLSKYVKTALEALDHTGDGYIYGAPRIFGTYTGRFTYSNSTSSKDFNDEDSKNTKVKCCIALHQMPRKEKPVRRYLTPPPGYKIYEADASGQESRLMALRSGDPVMLDIFARGLNFHSVTGASIIGFDYEEFEANRDAEDGKGYYTEQRQLGKLANLSCNYRIGGKALSQKAFLDYDTYMTVGTGQFLVNTFNRTFAGVPQFWEDVIWESKQRGYTEAFGGRRYKLTDWSTHRWITESSAINHPIQGAGASMKEIAIAETYIKVPEAKFVLDLHDANFFYVPEVGYDEICAKLDYVLNNIDYTPYWGFTPSIPLPYESAGGYTFADVK